jgi:hypothetical protein
MLAGMGDLNPGLFAVTMFALFLYYGGWALFRPPKNRR